MSNKYIRNTISGVELYIFLFRMQTVAWQQQGSRKCGSTGAALLGNGTPNWGNDATWEKEKKKKKEENKERKKKTNGKWGKRMKGKREGRGKEMERRQRQNVLKSYRVNMKIFNTKYGIVNVKKWGKGNLLLNGCQFFRYTVGEV